METKKEFYKQKLQDEKPEDQKLEKQNNKLFKEPEYASDPNDYLFHNGKLVFIQIGKTFYKLKEWVTISTPEQLNTMLDAYDVRLLKEKGG